MWSSLKWYTYQLTTVPHMLDVRLLGTQCNDFYIKLIEAHKDIVAMSIKRKLIC